MSFICGDCHHEHKVPTREEDESAKVSAGSAGLACVLALVRERNEMVLQNGELRDKLILANGNLKDVYESMKPHLPEHLRSDFIVMGLQVRYLIEQWQEMNRLNDEYFEQIEWAWSVIANAGPEGCLGNWSKLAPGWVEIAEKWRDEYHAILNKRVKRSCSSHFGDAGKALLCPTCGADGWRIATNGHGPECKG